MSMASCGTAHSLHNKYTKSGAIWQTLRDKSYETHHVLCVLLYLAVHTEQNTAEGFSPTGCMLCPLTYPINSMPSFTLV